MWRQATLLLLLSLGMATFPAGPAVAQRPDPEKPLELPANSPSKLLKHQHEEVKKMSGRLAELATEVEEELEKHGENVLPLSTLKKLEEIEKLARKMRGRLKQ